MQALDNPWVRRWYCRCLQVAHDGSRSAPKRPGLGAGHRSVHRTTQGRAGQSAIRMPGRELPRERPVPSVLQHSPKCEYWRSLLLLRGQASGAGEQLQAARWADAVRPRDDRSLAAPSARMKRRRNAVGYREERGPAAGRAAGPTPSEITANRPARSPRRVAAVLFLDRDGRGPRVSLSPRGVPAPGRSRLDFVAGANGRETAERNTIMMSDFREAGATAKTLSPCSPTRSRHDGPASWSSSRAPNRQERAHRLDVRRHRRFLLGLARRRQHKSEDERQTGPRKFMAAPPASRDAAE